MGAGEIGLPSLRWMLDLADHELVGVYTQPDKKIGRKQVLTPPAVKVMAEEAGVSVFQPDTFRNNESAQSFPNSHFPPFLINLHVRGCQ